MPDHSGKCIYTHTRTHCDYLQVLGEEASGLCKLVKCPAGETGPHGNQIAIRFLICYRVQIGFDQAHYLPVIYSFYTGGPCIMCATGKFKSTAGSDACELCTAGKYGPTTGYDKAMDCIPCRAGTYSSIPGSITSSTCLSCPAGTYSGPATSECMKCGGGKYSSTLGSNTSVSCLTCPVHSTSQTGCINVSCCSCTAGYKKMESVAIDELVATDLLKCEACEAGKQKDFVGSATSCQDCRAGTFSKTSAADNSSYCLPCLYPQTSNKSGATECHCVQGFTRDCETEVSLRVHVRVCVCAHVKSSVLAFSYIVYAVCTCIL